MTTPETLARRTDPATSHAAAASVGEFAHEHREQILRAMPLPPENRTVHEIAAACRLDAHAVGKRMAELERASLVRVAVDVFGEVTRPSPSGRPARAWERVALRVGGAA